MSIWRDGIDFMNDIESLSEFYVKGHHNNPGNKFVVKSRKDQKPVYSPWYESDSDEEDPCSFGRGKKAGNNSKTPGETTDHLEVMKEIQMQVRSVVGHRYNNNVLESYYNVCKDDDPDSTTDTPSCAPKEVSIIYAKEQNLKNSTDTLPIHIKKDSIANNIHNSAAKLTNSISPSTSSSSSPKKENSYQRGNTKKRCGTNKNHLNSEFPFTSAKNEVNVNSEKQFPRL